MEMVSIDQPTALPWHGWISSSSVEIAVFCFGIVFTISTLASIKKHAKVEVSPQTKISHKFRKDSSDGCIDDEAFTRKRNFINSKHGQQYGYSSSTGSRRGHIDTWRAKEFPSLIKPISLLNKASTYEYKCDDIEKFNGIFHENANDNVSIGDENENGKELEVYLDYAGSAIPSKSLLSSIHAQSIENQILANPHSNGPSACRSKANIENVKKKVLDFFGANAGSMYGFQCEKGEGNSPDCEGPEEEENFHPGYDVIFTSGATHALQLVAENFDYTGGNNNRGKTNEEKNMENDSSARNGTFLYSHNSHTSVIGMREPAMRKGASFRCETMDDISMADPEQFNMWSNEIGLEWNATSNDDDLGENNTFKGKGGCEKTHNLGGNVDSTKHLLVFPLECNFGGARSDARSIIKTSRKSQRYGKWYSMLDIAKAASTSSINLRKLDPDFACVSFYKIFGAPTGIGALFVKRSSAHAITRTSSSSHSSGYFGGGAVDIALPNENFVRSRSSPSQLNALVHGTINFRNILSLGLGLDEINHIGMENISAHTRSLAIEAAMRLTSLKHHNGKPLVELYGPWGSIMNEVRNGLEMPNYLSDQFPGPTIPFNVLRSDGSFVGYNEVSKLAALFKSPIQVRTGCFCNPGGCQEALNVDDATVKRNYLISGKQCGDHLDIIDGSPTGAVRISIGKDSIWEDIDSVVTFIQRAFAGNDISHAVTSHETLIVDGHASKQFLLEEIYVFPIKSCAAMSVDRWKMNSKSGKLSFDREFALVDSSGMALRLSQYPKMCSIKPRIDIGKMLLEVSAPGQPKLVIDLKSERQSTIREIKVCGDKCNGKLWGSHAVSSWFTEYLGVQCWLARTGDAIDKTMEAGPSNLSEPSLEDAHMQNILPRRTGFENEAPLLLLSKQSVEILNKVLANQGSRRVNSRHFRPNLVVTQKNNGRNREFTGNPEEQWKSIYFPQSGINLNVTGQCARCSMVDIDPESGMKGKTLRALAEYRRYRGQITFGIFLKKIPSEDQNVWIQTGNLITPKI